MIPPYLKPGDKIGIVATARKIGNTELEPALEYFKLKGLVPVLGKHIFSEYFQFAGIDEERTADLQMMLDDPEIKAIIIARGGYGTIRIIDSIDFSAFMKNPKWIIGYSDITVLHSHIHKNCNVSTLHATMPLNFLKHKDATETLFNTLFGKTNEYKVPAHKLNRTGIVRSVVVGGNLSLLYALSGSESDIDTTGKILFIEDLDEYLYHIDRMMQQLKRSGKLNGLRGLIVGGMTDMKDNLISFGKNAEQIIRESVEEYDFPLCFNFPAGHQDENRTIVLGNEAELIVEESGTLFKQTPSLNI